MRKNPFTKLALLAGALFTSSNASAVDLDWLERFAIGNDRAAVLKELIPDSEDYYRFHTLHYQTTGQLDAAEQMLNRWMEDKRFAHTAYATAFRDRQMLLTFNNNPARTYEYMRSRLQIELNHAPPISNEVRRFPDIVSPELFLFDNLVRQAIRNGATLSQESIKYVGDQVLASPNKTFEGATAWWVLERLTDYNYKNLAKLVAEEIQGRAEDAKRFGDQEAHRHLTLDELMLLRKAIPQIANDGELVTEVLLRLVPPVNSDLELNPNLKKEYLQRVVQFASTLPESYNGLKASALYHLLDFNLQSDIFDKELFIAYLKTPRHSPLFDSKKSNVHVHDNPIRAEIQNQTALVQVPDDTPLIRTHLEYFLKDAANTNEFATLIHPDYLNDIYAETKLLYGADDSQRYFNMLSATRQREVKDRIELQLCRFNDKYSPADKPAKLLLDVKAVDKLIVRTYKINTSSYYRNYQTIVNLDVDLDGLTPSKEATYQYNSPSQVRHREQIMLPEIEGRGVWIVDLLGGGLRCRAVVRRGDLHAVFNTFDDGHTLTVLDENNARVANASVRVGSRELTADNEGRVVIPFVENAQRTIAILSDGVLSAPFAFDHKSENYSLDASMILPREGLQSGRMAKLLIRPQLRNDQRTISVTHIAKGTITITAKDFRGIETRRRFESLKFSDDLDTEVEFRVPDNCRQVTASLDVEFARTTNGQTQTLSASKTWPVATFIDTSHINDVHLTRSDENWVLEVRGRNGEAIRGAPLELAFTTTISGETISTQVQTNDLGQATFRADSHLSALTATLDGGVVRSWPLHHDLIATESRIFATTEDAIRVALVRQNEDANSLMHLRLVELRSDREFSDLSDRIKLEDGFAAIGKLEPGTYYLRDTLASNTTQITVTRAKVVDGQTTSTPWMMPVATSANITIESARFVDGKLTIRVPGASPFTRVHVLASRYVPRDRYFSDLLLRPQERVSRTRHVTPNFFASGLKLGEEYQYVLRRQSAKKFPGVILPQPSLILNPWVIDTADNRTLLDELGDMPAPAEQPSSSELAESLKREEAQLAAEASNPAYDFLANTAMMLTNLEVIDESIELDAKAFEDYPIVTIVAADPQQLVQRQIYQKLSAPKLNDLRLQQSYKAELNLAQQRSLRMIDKDHPITVAELGLADVQIYRTIGELLPVLGNINADQRWPEFAAIGQWHTYDDAKKKELYSRLACHELHLFLFVKDRAFFDLNIKPYLANKKEKQFIDRFLIGDDLRDYLVSWRYQQLNSAEKALLAIAVPEAKAAIVRELDEFVKINRIDRASERARLESAMAGKALEEDQLKAGVELSLAQTEMFFDKQIEALDYAVNGAAHYTNEAALGVGGYGGAGGDRSDRDGSVSLGRELKSSGAFKDNEMRKYFALPGRGLDRKQQAFFQALDQTKQWAESQWDRYRGIQDSSRLISANRFWKDLASASSLESFRTDYILDATDSRHASLVSLALLNLPMTSDFQLPSDRNAQIAPEQPVIIVSRQTVQLADQSTTSQIMIGQTIARVGATAESDDDTDDEIESTTVKEYLVNVPYEAKLTLTNLSSVDRNVNVLWQIPAGAIGLPGNSSQVSLATDSASPTIGAFSTTTLSFAFYFPQAGLFKQYPACVSRKMTLVARCEPVEFEVVTLASQVDETSWEYIAEKGTPQQIEAYLNAANLRKLQWSRLYHRLNDRAIYDVAIASLRRNFLVEPVVLGYSIEHKDKTAFGELLTNRMDLATSIGPYLQCELLNIEPIERKLAEHLEFAPLIVPRIHPLRDKHEFTNLKLEEQYTWLLETIAHANSISASTELAIVYYQLINNRIDEAITRFRSIEREKVTTVLSTLR